MSVQSAFRNPPSPISSMEWRWAGLAALAVVLVSSLPYIIVSLTTPPDLRFGGVLVNPIDGQSYLAKMQQGYDGYWLFRLPYTAHDEPDALVYTHYPALGHIARVTGMSLVLVYHLARAAGGWLLLLTSYGLIARLADTVPDRRRAWLFVAWTSGLGWTGLSSTDVTIPESNTFFSIMTNAHFAAATALMLFLFMAVIDRAPWRAALAAIGLAVLQPFAPIAVFAALFASGLTAMWLRGRGAFSRRQVIAAVVAGLSITPLIAYFYLATQQDPILREWMAQNLTPSPPPIDYLMGYGVMWLLAFPGARAALKRGRDVDVLLVAWAVTSALLLYAPFPLQRRFSLGLHIPIVLLGVMGLGPITQAASHRLKQWLPRLVFVVSLPTTLLLLLATSSAALGTPDGRLFFSSNESAAFDWLRDNVPHESVVLAAPETGLFLPAWADVRVLYGHPFETVDAENTKAAVRRFFAGTGDRAELLRAHDVDYIFFGPREAELGQAAADWRPVFRTGDVTIYRVP